MDTMSTTTAAEMKTFLCLPTLHLVMENETIRRAYRLLNSSKDTYRERHVKFGMISQNIKYWECSQIEY